MRKIPLILLLLFIPSILWGACGGSSPTLTAASANYVDVKACTDIATYGDTVNIPACAQDACVWTNTLSLTKNIKLIGAGNAATYITNGFSAGDGEKHFITFTATSDATTRANLDSLEDTSTFEISGIHFYSASVMSYKYAISIYNASLPIIRRVKIYDNAFTNFYMAVDTSGYVYGVMYNNTITNTRVWKGGGNDSVNDWTNMPMVPGSGDAFYIEDNTISVNTSVGALTSGANSGGGQVFRYNTASGTMSGGTLNDTHSIAGGQRKGSQMTEIYGNNFPVSGCGSGVAMRGGKARVFFNYMRSDNALQVWQEYRDGYSTPPITVYPDATPWAAMQQNYDCTGSGTPYGCCTGSHTGSCVTAQVCSSSANNCYKVNHTYFWNNRRSDTNAIKSVTKGYDHWNRDLSIVSDPLELVQNREWWEQGASFDGTSGVGCGTLATLQGAAYYTECTAGVGYWATDQSCADLTGLVGANPATPISGTLYKCNATGDGWDSYYTLYDYPHPLRGESETTHTVTVSKVGNGATLSADGDRVVYDGNQINVVATRHNGWNGAWSGDCPLVSSCTVPVQGVSETCTVTPTGNCSMTYTATEIKLLN